ncbi:MAG: isochorismatase family protein [Calditrichota bacterium]
MTTYELEKTWVEKNLPPEYQELAKKKHLPLPGRVGFGERPAVLVIDMARAWCDPDSPMGTDMSECIANIRKVLDVARQPGPEIPVFFTVMAYDPSLKGITEVHNRKRPHLAKLLTYGSPWLEIDPRLERRPDELLMVKEHGSCLTDTVLLRMLVSNRCDTLIITGCSTSFCVMATCYDASTLGFHGIVPAEAVNDRDPIMHKYMLLNLDWKVVDVEPVEKVVNYLAQYKRRA